MKDSGYSDSDEDSLSHGSSQDMFTFDPLKSLGFEASSSRNISGDLESGHGNFKKLKQAKNVKPNGANLSTVDEINFAIDGLRSGQSLRIRRTSLLSLLSICSTIQQRRSLRSHGMAKTMIDSILGINLDDPHCNLAAAALFHVLTSDDKNDRILDSPSSIRFLIKLLKQHSSGPGKSQSLSIGNRILAVGSKGDDSTSSAIVQKVEEILDAINSSNGNVHAIRKLEQRAKWIALLTMEKACLSTISTEDATISGRKSGGNFKEKLREFGGLDAVFEITRDCHSILERWLKQASSKNQELKENADPESLLLLLQCLKVVENATIFSKNNQDHLLGLRGSFTHPKSPESFIKLIISAIGILSGLSLLKNSMDSESLNAPFAWIQTDDVPSTTDNRDCTAISRKKFGIPESTRWLPARCSGKTKSTSNSSEYEKSELVEGSQDPFAFDDLEFKPSKWEGESRGQVVKKNQNGTKRRSRNGHNQVKLDNHGNDHPDVSSSSAQPKLGNQGNGHPDVSSSSAFDEETQNLLADCLLDAVKALMNVTNENPLGCSQIAANGGLEILALLLAGHFPLFTSSAHLFADTSENTSLTVEDGSKIDKHLSEQELNLLVAILGLLVNLVEKDGHNRMRLAAAVIPLPSRLKRVGKKKTHGNVVPLLCSVFLENQGAGEAAEEGKAAAINWDDEEAFLQGEKEAEMMIVEAYAALLLAFLSTQSKEIRNSIVKCLPDNNLAVLVPVLERFVEFHMMLNVISAETHAAVLEVIESCRK
ncbi:wings apart-like protein 2 [Impatiens glandulifera]|uniref:wings apart-like protein 2 n=1 Tax=Impatiens glandulifera TaxID=253017 RepID=UPI001FB139E6|nr:wings apart-like protein 2 [Impatiens glandulifera]